MVPFPVCAALGLQGLSKTKWDLREHEIGIFDIEFITKTTLKLDIEKIRGGDRAAIADAQAQLANLASDFTRPEWTEGDWSKVKDMTFMELNQAKQQETAMVLNTMCLSCPKFVTHVSPPTPLYELVIGLLTGEHSLLFAIRSMISRQKSRI